MKWFKHDTDGYLSEGLSFLLEEEGFAGYGRWFRLLEIVALKMDGSNCCSAEYPISKWCSLLGLKQKKLISFLKLTENKLKTKVVSCENIIKIEIPNLLKKRDEYSQKSGHNPDNVRPKNKEIRIKNKEKKEKNILTENDFLTQLKNLPCYKGIDIDNELYKMDAWFLTPKGRGRKKTKSFIINWLNKIDKPLSTGKQSITQIDGGRVIKNSYDCHNCKKTFTDYNQYLTHKCIEGAFK